MLVFDFEGCLVDTTEARRRAWAAAGVTTTDRDLERPISLWLAQKFGGDQDKYSVARLVMRGVLPKFVAMTRVLPMLGVARQWENFTLMCDTDDDTAALILETVGVRSAGVRFMHAAHPSARPNLLRSLVREGESGAHVTGSSMIHEMALAALPSSWACSLVQSGQR